MVRQKESCPTGKVWNKDWGACMEMGDIVITKDTTKLIEEFGLPPADLDFGDFYTEIPDSLVEEMKEKYGLDCPDDSEISGALWDEQFYSYGAVYGEEVREALKKFMELPDGYHYEYYSSEDDDYYSGDMEGVKGILIDHENTRILVSPKFKHTINAMIAGHGMFDTSGKRPESVMGANATIKDWMESHISWLKEFPDIYGVSRPEPDYDHLHYKMDFDEEYLIESLLERGCKLNAKEEKGGD